MLKSNLTISLAATLLLAKADQPVHCLKSQVAGKWTLEVSTDQVTPDIFSSYEICTHNLPNRVQVIPKNHKFEFPSGSESLYLMLDSDMTVKVLDAQGIETGETGGWSMIYDQAFMITLPDRKQRFQSNFKFTVKDSVLESQYSTLRTDSNGQFDSICSESMVGFVQTNKTAFQCAVGRQTEALNSHEVVQEDSLAVYVAEVEGTPTTAQVSDPEMPTQSAQIHSMPLTAQVANPIYGSNSWRYSGRPDYQVAQTQRQAFANAVNDMKLTWQASDYAQINSVSHDLGFAQVSRGSSNVFADGSQKWIEALAEAQKYLQKANEIEELPKSFSWEDVNGYDFTAKIADQKGCGSCYVVAQTSVLESRIKIWFGQDIPLSSQMSLQCNFMNEGCKGGWGIFNGFFLEAYYATNESCGHYKGETTPGGCAEYKDCPKVAKVQETYYLGDGHYGGMTELDMMRELRANGPFLYDFLAAGAFQQYKSGILTQTSVDNLPISLKTLSNTDTQKVLDEQNGGLDVSDRNYEDYNLDWEKLTHSTMLIGWGYDESQDMKYWIVRNSYGPNWGESGNFKVRRGMNDFGGEAESSAFIPELLQ